jgi:quercetin dioxygenase-like cupin family protein
LGKTLTVRELRDVQLLERRPGLKGATLFDEKTPTEFIFSGIFSLEPGKKLEMHYHDREEIQYVTEGNATLRDSNKKEYKVNPGTTFFCPIGPQGAHEIENTGNVPFVCLYIYNSPGGKRVSLSLLREKES